MVRNNFKIFISSFVCMVFLLLTAGCDGGGGGNDATAVRVTGVTLKTSTAILVGQTEPLAAAIEPANASDKSVTWKSDNEIVATVNDGVVTGVSAGTAKITVTTNDGGFTDDCTVTVTTSPVRVRGVALTEKTLSISPKESKTLFAVIDPSGATDQVVEWTSSKDSVATVINGEVTGVSDGTAVITATTRDGGFKDTCEVTVETSGSAGAIIIPEGTWVSNAVVWQNPSNNQYARYVYIQSGENITKQIHLYQDDSTCTNPSAKFAVLETKGAMDIAGGSDDGLFAEYNMTMQSTTLRWVRNDFVVWANNDNCFGYSDWTTNVARSIAGRTTPEGITVPDNGEIVYDVYQFLDSSSLCFGDYDIPVTVEADRTIEANRPTTVDTSLVYTRVNYYLELFETSITMDSNSNATITADARTAGGADDTITAVSSDTSIATIEVDGLNVTVTGVKAGVVNVIITSGSGLEQTCVVTVNPSWHTVFIDNFNGSVLDTDTWIEVFAQATYSLTGTGELKIDGGLRSDGDDGIGLLLSRTIDTSSVFKVSTRFRATMDSGDDYEIGLFLNYSSDTGYYFMRLRPYEDATGVYELLIVKPDDTILAQTLPADNFSLESDAWYILEASYNGGNMVLSLKNFDGSQTIASISASDTDFTSGSLGLLGDMNLNDSGDVDSIYIDYFELMYNQ